ncbi:MAG: PAS domain S-box protein [Candidatus Omnitrophica bacterium]|nr:PAS domain S-box protein [Candidatus Omnitrophota bacterium]MBU1925251.1 PAS domain S-box protein [Candidatus Omnitrophota bacterium]
MADKFTNSENDYSIIFNAVSTIIVVHDPQTGQILDVNEKACGEFGYNQEEFKKLTVEDISTGVPPYTLREAVERVKKAAQGVPQTFDWRCKDKSGRQFWAEVNLKQVNIGGQDKILAVVSNIDERKKIEALSKLKEDLLEKAPLGQKLKSVTGAIVDIFGADFARIWAIKKGDLCDNGCFHAREGKEQHACRDRGMCLHLLASSGRYTHTDGAVHKRVPFGAYKIGQVASGELESFVTNDVAHDARVHNNAWAKELGLVSFCGFRLLSAQGEPIGVLALFSKYEITQEITILLEDLAVVTSSLIQNAEIERARLEEKFFSESAMNSLPGIFYIFDETGRFIRWNENFERISEYTREEIVHMRPADFFKEDAAIIARAVQEIFIKGEARAEAAFKSKSGKSGVYFFTGKKIEIFGKNYIVGTGADITERKDMEQKLRESEFRYRNIVDNVADAMCSYDFNGQIVDTNSNACKMLGYSKEELIGAPLAKIEPRESAAQIQGRIAQLRDKGHRIFENTLRSKTGQMIAVNISARVVSEEGAGKIQSFMRDVTEQQVVQDELRRKIKDLELFYRVAVGREMKMVEMKKEIFRLQERLAEFMTKQKK